MFRNFRVTLCSRPYRRLQGGEHLNATGWWGLPRSGPRQPCRLAAAVEAMDDKSMAQKSTFSMHRHLRVKWLALVNTCLYQVQKELLDVDLLRTSGARRGGTWQTGNPVEGRWQFGSACGLCSFARRTSQGPKSLANNKSFNLFCSRSFEPSWILRSLRAVLPSYHAPPSRSPDLLARPLGFGSD